MNVTLSLDDKLVERARALAASRGTSLNDMIRALLAQATAASAPSGLLEELEQLWSEGEFRSKGRRWTRDELHDRALLR